ncbi:MAG: hypothetical protein KDE22_01065 [Rhodobacterales bacterium]|nr:hypothetical protein [Rhodobacterales bacterium]
MMDDILGLARPKPAGDAPRLKALVRRRLGLGADSTVMVSELRCHEDGCPDVETVVAVLAAGRETESWKIPKPMARITEQDLAALPAR